jgi:hypothetical protein
MLEDYLKLDKGFLTSRLQNLKDRLEVSYFFFLILIFTTTTKKILPPML